MVGAVAFHLSPWLGVSVPTGLTEGAAAPWNADDFVATTTVAPFVLAIVTCVGSLLVMRTPSAWASNGSISLSKCRRSSWKKLSPSLTRYCRSRSCGLSMVG